MRWWEKRGDGEIGDGERGDVPTTGQGMDKGEKREGEHSLAL